MPLDLDVPGRSTRLLPWAWWSRQPVVHGPRERKGPGSHVSTRFLGGLGMGVQCVIAGKVVPPERHRVRETRPSAVRKSLSFKLGRMIELPAVRAGLGWPGRASENYQPCFLLTVRCCLTQGGAVGLCAHLCSHRERGRDFREFFPRNRGTLDPKGGSQRSETAWTQGGGEGTGTVFLDPWI